MEWKIKRDQSRIRHVRSAETCARDDLNEDTEDPRRGSARIS